MKNPISIQAISTISPLGSTEEEIWRNYSSEKHFFKEIEIGGRKSLVGELSKELKQAVNLLRDENSKYRHLDDSVLFAILAGRNLELENDLDLEAAGINIGSSRGATGLFEKYHTEYIRTGKTSTYSSPTTTLGNISSWVAQDLQLNGPQFSHSVTCSTGMHAILNAVAWLQSGMASSFVAGGSEAPLTGFTLSQMKAMKIYASENLDFPCRSLDMKKERNTMILGEGAGLVILKEGIQVDAPFLIEGIGYANEKLKHGASLSKKGKCLQKSMKMAMNSAGLDRVDAVVMHAPGTIGGDNSEVNAIRKLLGDDLPAMTSNKWKTGHSFAASGIWSLQMASMMLEHQEFLPVPFSEYQQIPEKLDRIMVNSVGFGGNAVSLIVSKN
ncbi:beta-ketoacyl synthase [Gramella sp. BOM4]|nr:beta-ketoacyl synthase [Christiangramia bathymodioli]